MGGRVVSLPKAWVAGLSSVWLSPVSGHGMEAYRDKARVASEVSKITAGDHCCSLGSVIVPTVTASPFVPRLRCTPRRSSMAPQRRSSCCWRFPRRSGVPWKPLSTYVPLISTCSAAISTASCSWIPPAPVTVPSLHASPSLYDKWQQLATLGKQHGGGCSSARASLQMLSEHCTAVIF